MAKFFISLGIINKKMLIPLIYIILYSLVNIYDLSVEYDEIFEFMGRFGVILGELSSFFVGQIIKYRTIKVKKKQKKKKSKKQLILDFFFLFLINTFFMLMAFIPLFFLKKDKEEEGDKYRDFFIIDALEAVLLTVITYFALKYKYYLHHIISLIIIVILSLIMDLIIGNFKQTNTYLLISSILYFLATIFLYTYYKYLIEKKYYHFTDISFILGIFDSFLFSLSLGIVLIEQKIKGTYKLIFQFYESYQKKGAWYLTSIFLVGLIPRGLILYLIELKIVDDFNPNFVCIAYQISKMPSTIISIEGNIKWAVLVLEILQIFIFLFYLEVLEYNFCSLNKNTKKNIAKREHNQSISDNNDDDDEIDIKGYDVSESVKMQEKIKEINEMNEVFEEEEKDDTK